MPPLESPAPISEMPEPMVEEPALVAQAESRAPGNSVAWAPGQDAVTIQVGQFVDITAGDPLSTVVSSSDPRTLKAFPGKQEEGKVLYPAAKGINPGAATLTVTLPDGTVSNISVTVNGR
jgi:chorismate synthase